jgi:hypothetical protein
MYETGWSFFRMISHIIFSWKSYFEWNYILRQYLPHDTSCSSCTRSHSHSSAFPRGCQKCNSKLTLITSHYPFFCTVDYSNWTFTSRGTELSLTSQDSIYRLAHQTTVYLLSLPMPLFLTLGKWVYLFWWLSMQSSVFINLAKSSPFVRKFN